MKNIQKAQRTQYTSVDMNKMAVLYMDRLATQVVVPQG